ncbi:MAG: TIGR02530 family flagellar biosynthesis protein [Thermoleophilia bacterium]
MTPVDPTVPGARGVGAAGAVAPAGPGRGTAKAGASGFDQMLAQRLQSAQATAAGPLKWSAHARDRLAQRGIQVTPEVASRLEDAVNRAAAKGSKDSLVMVDNTAFVVSVKNRVVITAVHREGLKDQVFTNIDSAVLAP